MLWSLARPGALYKAVREGMSNHKHGRDVDYVAVGTLVCVECSLKNGESGRRYFQKIGSLGKVGGQTNPTKGRETERRREQGWDDWDGYGKAMYVIPHYRQASLPNCDLPAV